MPPLDIKKILTELKEFKSIEVSYVNRGAVKIPFLITKEDDVGKKELAKLIGESKLENFEEIKKTLAGIKIDSDKADAITGGLRIFSVLKSEIGEEPLSAILGLSGISAIKKQEDGDDEKEKEAEEMREKITKLEGDNTDLVDRVEKAEAIAKSNDKKGDPVDIMKSLPIKKDGSLDEGKIPEELRGAVVHLFKAHKDSSDLISKVEKSLAEERDIRITKAYQEKAAVYGNIKVDGLSTILKDVALKAPEAFKGLESILKVANDGLGKNPEFSELGGSGSGFVDDGKSAEQLYQQIEKEAEAAITGEISLIEKMDKFMTGNERGQQLYMRYQSIIRKG